MCVWEVQREELKLYHKHVPEKTGVVDNISDIMTNKRWGTKSIEEIEKIYLKDF